MSNVLLRVATVEDATSIQAIYAPYVETTAITFEEVVPSVEEFEGRIQKTLENFPYLVLEEDGEVVGYAYAGRFSARAAFDWSSKQAYIVMANMMTMAAYEGLDSCALEGFNQDKMTVLLGDELGLFDTKHFGIAVMAAFGYRDEEPHRNKTRRTMNEIVTVV